MPGRIVFIDDERKIPEYYTARLGKENFEVVRCQGPDEAIDYLKRNPGPAQAFILDIMMPSGEAYKDCDTDDDTNTGLLLYAYIRKQCPTTPIVILTNRQISELPQEQADDPNKLVLWKPDCTPSELAEQVKSLISSGS